MKVKESKVIRHKWSETFRVGVLSSCNKMPVEDYCEILRKNGITYEIENVNTCGDVRVIFVASFREVSKLAEDLNIDFTKLTTYL